MAAAEPLSLLEFVHALLADTHLRGLFADDPRATLEAHGLGDLTPADVHDALDLVQDNEITDFSHHPAWDVDPEAFGHGGTPAADHLTWPDAGAPAVEHWAAASSVEDGSPSHEAGWADDGYGTGHEIGPDLAPFDPADAPGPDLHHQG